MCHSPGGELRSSAGGVVQEGRDARSTRSPGGDGCPAAGATAGGSGRGSPTPACPRRRRTGRCGSPLVRRDHRSRTARSGEPSPPRPNASGAPPLGAAGSSCPLASDALSRAAAGSSYSWCPAQHRRERPAHHERQVGSAGGRARRWVPVCAGSRRVRQWLRRERRNVVFRGGRDEFRERPAAVGRRIFREGVISVFRGVFRLPRGGIRARLRRCSRCRGKVAGPHVGSATAAKLFPWGNGMPVIASPHRSPLSVPALRPPARSPILGHFRPDRRRVDQGVIRLPAGDGVRSPRLAPTRRGAAR